jgi:NADH-quinone oxidoreductase subunit K
MFALFVVILAAAEAAIALAIVLRIFHDFGTIDITRTDSLRD